MIDDDREYSIHATGSEIGEPGWPDALSPSPTPSRRITPRPPHSPSTTVRSNTPWTRISSAYHSAARYANSTLSGTWSSFDSHVIYENETDDSASGYVVEDPQTGQVSYNYESNGTDSIDYHHYGGGSTLSIDIDDSCSSTVTAPAASPGPSPTNTTPTSPSSPRPIARPVIPTPKPLFGVPETDIDTVHLGTSMNLGGSGNLHDLIGSVTTRSLARDANGLAAGADEIHPILELQNPYHFVLDDSMEGNGTWDVSPGAWQYRRNWEVSQDEMLRSSGSNGAAVRVPEPGGRGRIRHTLELPECPGWRETGMASEAATGIQPLPPNRCRETKYRSSGQDTKLHAKVFRSSSEVVDVMDWRSNLRGSISL